MNMKTLIPFFGILLNLNLFFAAAVTGQEIRKAIKDDNLAAIQGFIAAGVNFNQTFGYGSTPLIHAIDCDRIEIALAILAVPGIDINYPSINGHTPIHHAAHKGSDEMIRLLLADERCARNQLGISGKTPLQIAALWGHTSTVQALLEDPRVDRNIVTIFDKTALDFAILYGCVDTAIVLINDPLVVKDRIDEKGMTILHKIAQNQDCDEVCRANKLRILEAVLHVGGIDLNHQDYKGKTALHYAVESDEPEMVLKLTAAGADSEIEDELGQNAIYYAEKREPALEQNYLEALYSVFGHSRVGLK